ncbi:hypothetical protein ACHWQZ_G004189 [Mnemiopsis leidyi]
MIVFTAFIFISSLLQVTESTDCKARRELQRANSDVTAPGYYEVQCDTEDENTYLSRQCWPSTGRCWCVDMYGETIPNSHVNPGQPPINCTTFGHCKAAELELLKGLGERKAPPPGAYMPQCDEAGNYAKTQNWYSTGQSWCASINGNKVPGTITGPTETAWDCDNLPACLAKEASLAHLQVEGIYPFGLDRPECNGEGKFQAMQCHGSTGHCWCADQETGEEKEETRQGPGEGLPNCSEVKLLAKSFDEETASACQRLHNTQMEKLNSFDQPLLGFWTVSCEDDGSFTPTQCHPSTGHCWCVDEFGTEISGSRSTPGAPRVPCLKKSPTCADKKQEVDQEIEEYFFVGMFTPECEEDGSYKPKQCWGSTGQCWCVTRSSGSEIAFSRRGPTEKPDELDCTKLSSPPPMRLAEVRDDPGSDDEGETEPVKGTSTALVAIIAILACVLILVLVVGAVMYRRRRSNGAKYASVREENPEL